MAPAGYNEISCAALQAEGPRFEPATAHHQIKGPQVPFANFSPAQLDLRTLPLLSEPATCGPHLGPPFKRFLNDLAGKFRPDPCRQAADQHML